MNNKEITSEVLGAIKALKPDARIPRRQVLQELRTTAKYFIDQKIKDGNISIDKIFRSMKCVPLIKIDSVKCPVVDFRTCNIVMRTRDRIPEPLRNKYGPMIKNVMNLDSTVEFKKTTKTRNIGINNRNIYPKTSNNYYYEYDGYLYIPSTEIYLINFDIATLSTEDLDKGSECSNSDCKSIWDAEFILPDNIERVVIDTVIELLAGTRQLVSDENPNMNERT